MLNNQPQMQLKLLQKKQFKKTVETADDLIDSKIANEITKKSPQNTLETVQIETEIPKGRHTSKRKTKRKTTNY